MSVRALLRAGASLRPVPGQRSPLLTASVYCRPGVARLLLGAGADAEEEVLVELDGGSTGVITPLLQAEYEAEHTGGDECAELLEVFEAAGAGQ